MLNRTVTDGHGLNEVENTGEVISSQEERRHFCVRKRKRMHQKKANSQEPLPNGEIRMDKRYQVFLSSTYNDLREERREVIQALLELDCIPSAMELFPAADEDQWSVIKQVIDKCDYYILILGGRYGDCGSDGMGFTEKEYRYARSQEMPVIAFLHRNPGEIPMNKSEETDPGKERLVAFRKLIEDDRLFKYWANIGELGGVVSRSMTQLMKSKPAVGWVRADQLSDKEAVEIVGLRRRIDELEAELAQLSSSAPKGSEDLAQGEDVFELNYRYLEWYGGREIWSTGNALWAWSKIFGLLAPRMLNECPERDLIGALVSNLVAEQRELQDDEECGHFISKVHVDEEDFQTIKVQLKALGLITHSSKGTKSNLLDTCWTLTPYGERTLNGLRAIRRNMDKAEVA